MPGEFVSYSQESWGGDPAVPGSAAQLLQTRFDFVYPFGFVEVGIPGTSGYSMIYTLAASVLEYLPASGGNAPLNRDDLDPTSSSSGSLGGYVLALQLDVEFADAGYLSGSSGIPLADLVLANMESYGFSNYAALNGLSVRQFLGIANNRLGGRSGEYTLDDIAIVTNQLALAFEGGQPSEFAQNHLRMVPEPAGSALSLLAFFLYPRRRQQ
jgi:hypothetical protein